MEGGRAAIAHSDMSGKNVRPAIVRSRIGGFNMSGLGTKAGGPGYLLQFTEPRVITENTMRRGFSPEIS